MSEVRGSKEPSVSDQSAPEPVANSIDSEADASQGPISTPVKAEFDWSAPVHVYIPVKTETPSPVPRRLVVKPVKSSHKSPSERRAHAPPVKAEFHSPGTETAATPVKVEVNSSGTEAVAIPVKDELNSSGTRTVVTPVKAEVNASSTEAVTTPVKAEAVSSGRKPLFTPAKADGILSPGEKLVQVLSDAKKSADSMPSPARKNLQLDRKIQALVHGAEETLNTSRYVLVGDKRNQRSGVLALKSLHQEAANEYETLYAAYQSLLAQHTKLLADLSIIMLEAAVDELQPNKDTLKTGEESVDHLFETLSSTAKLEPKKDIDTTDKDSVEDLVQMLSAVTINVDKTSEAPAVTSPPSTPN